MFNKSKWTPYYHNMTVILVMLFICQFRFFHFSFFTFLFPLRFYVSHFSLFLLLVFISILVNCVFNENISSCVKLFEMYFSISYERVSLAKSIRMENSFLPHDLICTCCWYLLDFAPTLALQFMLCIFTSSVCIFSSSIWICLCFYNKSFFLVAFSYF